jgi:hypothetical protein
MCYWTKLGQILADGTDECSTDLYSVEWTWACPVLFTASEFFLIANINL